MQAMPGGANRLTLAHHTADVQPCHSFSADLDHRRQVIECRREELANPLDGFWIRQDKSGLRTQVLCLAQGHAGHDAKGQRLLRRSDDVLVPESDDDRRSIKVRPPRQLDVTYEAAADARGDTSFVANGISVTMAR